MTARLEVPATACRERRGPKNASVGTQTGHLANTVTAMPAIHCSGSASQRDPASTAQVESPRCAICRLFRPPASWVSSSSLGSSHISSSTTVMFKAGDRIREFGVTVSERSQGVSQRSEIFVEFVSWFYVSDHHRSVSVFRSSLIGSDRFVSSIRWWEWKFERFSVISVSWIGECLPKSTTPPRRNCYNRSAIVCVC
jgi:hypothetical protein